MQKKTSTRTPYSRAQVLPVQVLQVQLREPMPALDVFDPDWMMYDGDCPFALLGAPSYTQVHQG